MKKLVCGLTKCFFDTYEPKVIYECKKGEEALHANTDVNETNITLPESIADYKFLDIYFCSGAITFNENSYDFQVKRCFVVDNSVKKFTAILSNYDQKGSEYEDLFTTIKMQTISIAEDVLTMCWARVVNFAYDDEADNGISIGLADTNSVIITKIVGWK